MLIPLRSRMAVSVSTYVWLLWAALVACSRAGAGHSSPEPGPNVSGYGGSDLEGIIPLVELNLHDAKTPFLVVMWISVAGGLKLGKVWTSCLDWSVFRFSL